MCIVSIIFSVNKQTSIEKVQTLSLIFLLMFSIINYLDSVTKLKWIMKSFVISGLASSLYILLTSDFSEISRYGEELGNVNAVGLIVGIACIFCFYFILEENKHLFRLVVKSNATIKNK